MQYDEYPGTDAADPAPDRPRLGVYVSFDASSSVAQMATPDPDQTTLATVAVHDLPDRVVMRIESPRRTEVEATRAPQAPERSLTGDALYMPRTTAVRVPPRIPRRGAVGGANRADLHVRRWHESDSNVVVDAHLHAIRLRDLRSRGRHSACNSPGHD